MSSSSRASSARTIASLAAAATVVGLTGGVAGVVTATAASAATSTASATAGLYGSADPTYDGAYRQSLALLGLHATGVTPAPAAVTWLLSQQCSDGGWQAFRSDLSKPCTASQEDSNSTAAAVAALVAVGQKSAAVKGATWLTGHQNTDGGIGYNPGSPSDPNSTGLFVGAVAALGTDPASVAKSGKSPYDSLQSFQLDCSAGTGAGAFYYPGSGKPKANDLATVQAVPGLLGLGLAVPATSQTAGTTPLDCSSSSTPALDRAAAAKAGAAYLAQRLQANKSLLPSSFGSGADYSTTAQAVLALVASGTGKDASDAALAALRSNAAAWVTGPAQQGLALLVNAAAGAPSKTFGGRDVVAALTASIRTGASTSPSTTPKPTASGSTKPSATATGGASGNTGGANGGGTNGTGTASGPQLAKTGAGSTGPLAGVGAGLLAVGGGLMLAARRRSTRRPAHRA